MRIGIVGSEAAKFTTTTEATARRIIRSLLTPTDTLISGACHLGGIDAWAVEEALVLGIPRERIIEHRPRVRSWSDGYKPRNLEIAKDSERVYCLTVKTLPPGYTGMTFALCYHCGTKDHVKSGGCWTVKQAKLMGKHGDVIVVE